ncbi:hypothetical protein NPIL_491701 [Nephila pilipes]|uniref:Uncharacterized protein n=1 Tax=Nephila pilipes TaxID=299642 RepID=A0A8X6TFC8_NEPPI|nr:hypothetical protein NPIL_491701 [Nephila pilipes]
MKLRNVPKSWIVTMKVLTKIKNIYEMKKEEESLQIERNKQLKQGIAMQQILAMLKEVSIKGKERRFITNRATLNSRDNVRKVLQNFIDKGGSQQQSAKPIITMVRLL